MPLPALNALISYTLGIFIAGFLSIPPFWIWLIALGCLISSLVPVYLQKQHFRIPEIQWKRFSRALLLVALFACGMLRLEMMLTSPIPANLYDQSVRFSGQMTYQPDRGELWEAGYATGTIQSMATPDVVVRAKILIRFREPIPLHYGEHIEVEGELHLPKEQRNPGGFDYRAYLGRRQVFGVLYPHRNQKVVPTHRSGFLLLRWTERSRRRVEAVIDLAYRDIPDHVLLLKGMLLGQRSELSRDILEAFQNSGSLHILAVSGLHVGLIAAVCFLGFSLLRLPRKITCLLTIVAVIFYACLVGFRASVLRASLMAVLFLIAQIIDRDADLINLLAFAALVLLLINPVQLWDVGFQLSFAAVASIVYLLPRWNSFTVPILTDRTVGQNGTSRLRYAWGQVVKWGVVAFGVTLSAQVGTFLILARHFYRVYPLGLIASPFAVGLVAPIVTLALISVLVGIIWLPLATPFVFANHLILSVFLGIIEFFGQPWGVQKIGPPGLGWIVVYIGGCLTVVHWRWVWEQRKKAALIGLTAAAIWIWDTAERDRGNLLEITFLDVGQGDAAFIQFPDGKTMLIDGGLNMRGYDTGERTLEPFLCHEGIFNLDLLLLSHPDNDHGGGFAHILQEFGVERVLGVPHQNLSPPTHCLLHAIVDEKGVRHELGYAGEIDLTSTARLELLHPYDEASTNLTDRDVNNDSLVLKITYGDVRILFTGDIEQGVESTLVANDLDLRAEIIKVPHHGSKTSSSADFLDAVLPQYAIFSLGKRNRYGFPAEMVVNRYRERECRVLRTDRLGAIRLQTDGRRCWISPYAER